MNIKDFCKKLDKTIFPEDLLHYKTEDTPLSKNIEILKKQLDEILNCREVGEKVEEKDSKDDEGLVISLKGSWGIGKTTFWNKYSANRFQSDKNVYVSLFGKNSVEDVKKAIFFGLYTRNKLLKKGSDFSGTSKLFGIDISSIINSLTKEDFKGKIICFDDFERISKNLDIREIMGFISNLKEEKKCKILIINNNNLLEIQDRLNDKEIVKKIENNRNTKYFITETNNDKIFKDYSEKVIDYNLYYEPTVEDNFKLINKTLNEVFDKNFILDLLENLSDINKKFNIRLMKILINNLNLFQFEQAINIDQRILNSIIVNIFLKVFNLEFQDLNLETEQININQIKKHIDTVNEKFYLDKESFLLDLNNLNSKITKDEQEKNLKSEINKIYFDYIYNLSYSDEKFIEEIYEKLKNNKDNIIKLITVETLNLYITRLIELDSNNRETYEKLFIESFNSYIDNLFSSEANTPYFIKEDYGNYLDKYSEIDNHFKEKLNKSNDKENFEVTKVIDMMKNPRKGGWSSELEKTLENISTEQHQSFILTNSEYFKTTLEFIIWINSFSGDRPFLNTYKCIISSYFLLLNEDKYKKRFIVTFKHLGIKSFRSLEIINIIRNFNLPELTHSFIRILQNNGLNSGIIDRLYIAKNKKYFMYEFKKILEEATNFENIKENRQIIINQFNEKIKFNFNFQDDYIYVQDIIDNYKHYDHICDIDN